jgi:hypothetical protein
VLGHDKEHVVVGPVDESIVVTAIAYGDWAGAEKRSRATATLRMRELESERQPADGQIRTIAFPEASRRRLGTPTRWRGIPLWSSCRCRCPDKS